jgi:nicotinate-nucleotide--dimethylbenzimidazole phosphoribosyltransferase
VDAGVAYDIPEIAGLIRRPIARGTNNFCLGPAMTRDQANAALTLGIETAERAVHDGCRLVGIGEMGIGNTTAASALTAALTGLPPATVTGRVEPGEGGVHGRGIQPTGMWTAALVNNARA